MQSRLNITVAWAAQVLRVLIGLRRCLWSSTKRSFFVEIIRQFIEITRQSRMVA